MPRANQNRRTYADKRPLASTPSPNAKHHRRRMRSPASTTFAALDHMRSPASRRATFAAAAFFQPLALRCRSTSQPEQADSAPQNILARRPDHHNSQTHAPKTRSSFAKTHLQTNPCEFKSAPFSARLQRSLDLLHAIQSHMTTLPCHLGGRAAGRRTRREKPLFSSACRPLWRGAWRDPPRRKQTAAGKLVLRAAVGVCAA